MSTFVEITSY